LAALQPPFIALTQKWNEVAQQANFTIATAVGAHSGHREHLDRAS
jgi:hypothetical protein